MGSGEEEFEDETIIEEDLYDEVSLLSTIWEESSKDLSRMGETLARLKLQKAATQQQLQLQQSEGEVDDHQQPVVLRKIPRRKRTVDVGTDDDHHQDNSEEDDGSRRPISHTTSSLNSANPSSRTHMVVSKNSTYTTTTASSGAKSIEKSTTQGAQGTHKERVSLESFLIDNHSNHSWADPPPPASPTKNKSTNKKCPSGRSAKPHESTSSSTNAGSATSPTLTSSGGRITLDHFLIDQPPPPLPSTPSTPLAIRRRSSSSGSGSGSSLGDFLEHTSPRSSAVDPTATAAVAAVTLVNYLTGEEVVVPEADDEYTYVSYLSDATGLSAASCSVNSMVSAEHSLNRSDHSIKRSSSSNNSGRSRHSVALSLDLDAIAEDTDDSD